MLFRLPSTWGTTSALLQPLCRTLRGKRLSPCFPSLTNALGTTSALLPQSAERSGEKRESLPSLPPPPAEYSEKTNSPPLPSDTERGARCEFMPESLRRPSILRRGDAGMERFQSDGHQTRAKFARSGSREGTGGRIQQGEPRKKSLSGKERKELLRERDSFLRRARARAACR